MHLKLASASFLALSLLALAAHGSESNEHGEGGDRKRENLQPMTESPHAGHAGHAAHATAATGDDGQGHHGGHEEHLAMMGRAEPGAAKGVQIQVHDLELLTQDGERVKLKHDVIADKLVAMTFVYTSCTTICPVFNAIFAQTQQLLGDRLGEEVTLISMTLDPARDVPARMKKEARKFEAKPGWVHLTGEKRNVDQVLRGLDAYVADYTLHPPMVLVGDGSTGTWKRINGFPPPERIVALIDELKGAREGSHR